jgi:UDP-3-O-[3-hydroxymyristoyl] glucosamine N-acyltransferase
MFVGALRPRGPASAGSSSGQHRKSILCALPKAASQIAQVCISGSTKLGNDVVLAGQVGLAGHLKIGNQVVVTAKSGVMHDIPDGGKWMGIPAQPDKQTKRQMIAIQHLPDLIRRVAELERKVGGKKE